MNENKLNDEHTIYFYVGTYTDLEGKGIYLFRMNKETGEIYQTAITENVNNPSYLTIDDNNKFLFAVNENNTFDDSKSGSISSFKIDAETKELEFINSVSSGGAHPCFLSIDKSNQFVLTANYTGANVTLTKINSDGSLDPDFDIEQHTGSSINKKRQNAPHAHSVYVAPNNEFVYAADLGTDKIYIYNLDLEKGTLTPNKIPFYKAALGSGPRHIAFHPAGHYTYLINELDNKIVALKINSTTGELSKINEYNALPKGFEGTSYCADIHIHPNGKFLYGSNRGDNSIVIFEIDESIGELKLIGHQSTNGDWPRNFVIDPTGKFLLVANQKSNNIFVFEIDQQSGLLSSTEYYADLPAPVCIKFLKK